MKEEKIKKEKKKIFDFKGLFKSFVSSSPAEELEKDIILSDASLSDSEKAELIEGLANNETLAHRLFADNLKVSKKLNLYKDTSSKGQKIKIDKNVINSNKDEKTIEEK